MPPTERSNSRMIMERPSASATGPMVANCCSTLNAVARLRKRPWPASTTREHDHDRDQQQVRPHARDWSVQRVHAGVLLGQRVQHDDAEHDHADVRYCICVLKPLSSSRPCTSAMMKAPENVRSAEPSPPRIAVPPTSTALIAW